MKTYIKVLDKIYPISARKLLNPPFEMVLEDSNKGIIFSVVVNKHEKPIYFIRHYGILFSNKKIEEIVYCFGKETPEGKRVIWYHPRIGVIKKEENSEKIALKFLKKRFNSSNG